MAKNRKDRRKEKKAKEKSDILEMAELIAGNGEDSETAEPEVVQTEETSEEIKTEEVKVAEDTVTPAEEVKPAEEAKPTEEVKPAETSETTADAKPAEETEAESDKKEKTKKVKKAKAPREKKKREDIDEYRRQEIKNYIKYAASAVVAIALIAVCGVTLVVNREAKRAGSGEVMKLTDVSEGLMPFSGITFSAEPITYEDMKNKNYTSARLEEIEAENERIDKILAERQAQREKKEKESEKATKVIEATGVSEYDPDDRRIIIPKSTRTTTYSYAGSLNPRTSITYADANGKYEDCGNFILTAYCPCPICCGQWSNMVDPHTASGAPAVAGVTVAVDPKVFPYGTKLMINGQIYTAQDCGGAIIGNHIDIYFNTHQEACNFGRQEAHVYRVIE